MIQEHVKKDRLADQVYVALKRLIVRHELPPGTRLSVPALSERFDVSRSPVREAVLQAVRDGLAIERPRQGVFVSSFNLMDLQAYFQLREVLEGLSARLAAERRTDESLAFIKTSLDIQTQRLEQDNIEGFIEADIAFHQAILSASQNPALQETLGQIYQKLAVALAVRAAPAGPDRTLTDHRAIVEAIEARDASRAESAARRHITQAIQRLSTPIE